jgi:hypothetical protein
VIDIESALVAWLPTDPAASALADDRIYTAIPRQPVWPLVRLTRIGGAVDSQHAWIDRPNVQIEAWADTRAGAFDLCQALVDALIVRLPGTRIADLTTVTHTRMAGGVVWSPDPADDRPRYLFDVEATCHR